MTRLTQVISEGRLIPAYFPSAGNIIPHSWYQKITTSAGKPDLTAISILSEIVYWHRPDKEGNAKFNSDAWQTSYEHFEKKFSYNRERIRRAFVLLEEKGIILRELRVVEKFGQKYGNILFLHLIDLSYLPSKRKKISDPYHKSCTPLPQIKGKHYIEEEIRRENKEKSRSMNSNFESENCEDSKSDLHHRDHKRSDVAIKELSSRNFCKKYPGSNLYNLLTTDQVRSDSTLTSHHKNLADYIPLSESDRDILAQKSGREFDLNFINQLLLKLSIKYPDHRFLKKDAFMNYLSKTLSNELRQACMVNRLDFKIVRDEKEIEENRYLSEIENSLSITKEALFKRKIAGILSRSDAYNLLHGSSISVQGDKLKIIGKKQPDINENIMEILLREARGVYGEDIAYIEHGSKNAKTIDFAQNKNPSSTLWQKVRNKLKPYYGEQVDKAWFSQLDIEDAENIGASGKLTLKAQTSFVRDWIKTHYGSVIEKQLAIMQPGVEEVVYLC